MWLIECVILCLKLFKKQYSNDTMSRALNLVNMFTRPPRYRGWDFGQKVKPICFRALFRGKERKKMENPTSSGMKLQQGKQRNSTQQLPRNLANSQSRLTTNKTCPRPNKINFGTQQISWKNICFLYPQTDEEARCYLL